LEIMFCCCPYLLFQANWIRSEIRKESIGLV
jgi:hypothetical protein